MIKNIQLPPLIAHRGASRYAPENTLTALRMAHTLGASWVECDIQLTRDREAVIFHDATLARCTDGHGRISHTNYATLKHLDAGAWFDAKFQGERIPSLSEWLQLAAHLKLGLNLELKGSRFTALFLVKELLLCLHKDWNRTLPTPLISSSSLACLAAVKKLAPFLPRALIADCVTPPILTTAKRLDCISLHTNYRHLTPKILATIQHTGLKTLIYTINNATIAKQWLALGVNGIFSDDPQLLIKK